MMRESCKEEYICFLTTGVHLVLSTSVRRRRNIPPSAEHLFRTCVHLDVQEAMYFFLSSVKDIRFLYQLCKIHVKFTESSDNYIDNRF